MAFKVMKEVEHRYSRLALGEATVSGAKPVYFRGLWFKTDRFGLPMRLPMLRRLRTSQKAPVNQCTLAILGSYRAYEFQTARSPFPYDELTRKPYEFDFEGFKQGLETLSRNCRFPPLRISRLLPRDIWLGSASVYSRVSAHGAPFDGGVLFQNPEVVSTMKRLYHALSKGSKLGGK